MKPPPLFELRDVHQRFGGVHALRGASLTLQEPGEVHALLGANGCGKSTLLKVATGQQRPDRGTILFNGEPVAFAAPLDALTLGIATVTQETTLAPDLSVAENIMMGKLPRGRFGAIDWRGTERSVRELLDSLGMDLPADVSVRKLRSDQQQMIEIARAFSVKARILILDEATSALTDDEVQAVFRVVRNASSLGMTTVFVSHRMDEIYDLADVVTILRDGQTVSTRTVAETGRETLVTDMTGLPTAVVKERAGHRTADNGSGVARLQTRELTVVGLVDHASISVSAGEIVGLTGLTRAGCHELMEAVFGARTVDGGQVMLDGQDITGLGIGGTIRAGIGFVPPDRKMQGALMKMSILQNLPMPSTSNRARMLSPRRRSELSLVSRIADGVSLRMGGPDAAVSTLSGGNQQKVVIGKWLVNPPKLLLLAEPSRGVDVNAKAQIHDLLREVAAAGAAVLFASSELDEVRELADRVVVMFRGRVMADLPNERATEHLVTSLMAGNPEAEGT